ncbi:MAG: DUF2958 domain-containing protein [Kiloniellales bacterium]
MKLLTPDIRAVMLRNGALRRQIEDSGEGRADLFPVVKLFTPDGACTWLLTELDPDDPDIAFGLCDLGMGFPELGTVRISELESVRGKLGLPIERDQHFVSARGISEHAAEARALGRINA